MQIEITGLTRRYRGGRTAIADVDLRLENGMTGLLGPNGAGKTTLMRILTGVLTPTSGRVLVDGQDMTTSAGRQEVKRTLGYLPQELALYPDLTGAEMLDYIALLKGISDRRERARQSTELLGRVGLSDQADQRLGRYSGGMKRRLGIAQALLGDPRLIVVDEPTSGLDPQERMRFRTLLASLGEQRLVILSTHILDDVAQACSSVCVLSEGRVRYHGSTSALTDVAEGRTYLVQGASAPQTDGVVVNATAESGGTRFRIVGGTPPAGATHVSPTLEDGYVALLQGTNSDEVIYR